MNLGLGPKLARAMMRQVLEDAAVNLLQVAAIKGAVNWLVRNLTNSQIRY
jgi:hypothetical protein